MPVSESAKPSSVAILGLIPLYESSLQRRGYRPTALHGYVRAVEHFLAWSARGADHVTIEESSVRRFLDEHLGQCDCPGRQQRGRVTTLSALRHLLYLLRTEGLVPPAPSPYSRDIQSELEEFCAYAKEVCGLAPATLISRSQWISRFLTHCFPIGRVQISQLGPRDVRAFFLSQCEGFQPGSAQVVASGIRSYLRFRAVRHADPVDALLAAIPLAAQWRLAALPESLSPSELVTLLAAFDHTQPQQQRDYAIVRCLVLPR